MEVEFARTARLLLEGGGMKVDYFESDAGHTIDPAAIQQAASWLERVISPPSAT
jgi:phospholipase/carboxylesterase